MSRMCFLSNTYLLSDKKGKTLLVDFGKSEPQKMTPFGEKTFLSTKLVKLKGFFKI